MAWTHEMGRSVVELNSLGEAVAAIYHEIIRTISDGKHDPCIPQEAYQRWDALMAQLGDGKPFDSIEVKAREEGLSLMCDAIDQGMRFGAMMAAALIAAKGDPE